jgi:hypothetical protein
MLDCTFWRLGYIYDGVPENCPKFRARQVVLDDSSLKPDIQAATDQGYEF